jgi:hypothetical protein
MVKLQKNRTFSGQATDPATGKIVTFRDTEGGDFFYHFHHGLLLGVPGAWIVGTAGNGHARHVSQRPRYSSLEY